MKDNTFLTRWGHTATVYERKIYVFGGRFCNDLNDILVLDPIREQVTTLKVHGDVPKARRRHSAEDLTVNTSMTFTISTLLVLKRDSV